jgi:hypothetical protein
MRIALVAALAAAAAATGAAAAADDDIPTRDCGGRIESGRGPLVFATSGALVVGPVSFSGLDEPVGLGPWGDLGRLGRKTGVLVRAGRPVVLSVPARYRDRLFLHYTRGGSFRARRRRRRSPTTAASAA